MSLNKVLEIARLELGVTEIPAGSNRVKYWDAYDPAFQGQPWCVAFLWWCFREAGERMAFFGGGKTASCSTLLRWYKENYQNIAVRDIQEGDIGFYNFSGGIAPEHCGLLTHVERSNGSILYAKSIEGNTTVTGGSEDNGGVVGVVAEKTRYTRNMVGAARPKYQPEPETKDDITGHWAEDNIRWCIAHGLMTGYPDGSFQPDKPVTRAELATVLRRLVLVEDKEDDLR